MGCNCKTKNNLVNNQDNINTNHLNNVEEKTTLVKVMHTSVKIIGFIISLLFIPIINIVIIWFLFKTLVLNSKIDFSNLIKQIGKWKKAKDRIEDEEELLAETNNEATNKFMYPVNKIKSQID
jgi:hypothetical protein